MPWKGVLNSQGWAVRGTHAGHGRQEMMSWTVERGIERRVRSVGLRKVKTQVCTPEVCAASTAQGCVNWGGLRA